MEVLYTVHGLWHLEDNLYKKWPVYAFLMRLEGSSIFYLEIKQDLHEGGKQCDGYEENYHRNLSP